MPKYSSNFRRRLPYLRLCRLTGKFHCSLVRVVAVADRRLPEQGRNRLRARGATAVTRKPDPTTHLPNVKTILTSKRPSSLPPCPTPERDGRPSETRCWQTPQPTRPASAVRLHALRSPISSLPNVYTRPREVTLPFMTLKRQKMLAILGEGRFRCRWRRKHRLNWRRCGLPKTFPHSSAVFPWPLFTSGGTRGIGPKSHRVGRRAVRPGRGRP